MSAMVRPMRSTCKGRADMPSRCTAFSRNTFRFRQRTEPLQPFAGQLGIGGKMQPPVTLALHRPHGLNALAHGCGRNLPRALLQIPIGHGRHLHMQVDTVQKRP